METTILEIDKLGSGQKVQKQIRCRGMAYGKSRKVRPLFVIRPKCELLGHLGN
jgi:hypothetical protein